MGGTYNPKTLEFFNKFEVNESVRVVWSYDHRPRIERFIEQEKEEVFVPFYEGKNIPVGVINSQPSPPVVNPFEQVSTPKQVNPFDQAVPAPQTNPFDQVPNAIPLNPFDTLISPTKGSVDQGGDEQNSESPESNNPFENVPVPTAQESNPFENVPLPGNPFDTLPKNKKFYRKNWFELKGGISFLMLICDPLDRSQFASLVVPFCQVLFNLVLFRSILSSRGMISLDCLLDHRMSIMTPLLSNPTISTDAPCLSN